MPGRHSGRETASLEDIIFHPDSPHYDPVAWDLFYDGIVRDNREAYEDLVDYMDYYYDIDFVDEFDWEDFDSPGVS